MKPIKMKPIKIKMKMKGGVIGELRSPKKLKMLLYPIINIIYQNP
jgi:hypothetical protein